MVFYNNYICNYNRAYSNLQLAWSGHEPLQTQALKNLHSSSYRFSLIGRVSLAISGILFLVPIITKISTKIFDYLNPPAANFDDREFRIIEEKKIPKKISQELKKASAQPWFDTENSLFNQSYNKKLESTPVYQENVKVSSMNVKTAYTQGRRPTMEDEHLATEFSVYISGKKYTIPIFGVFDGHGGREASIYMRKNLAPFMKKYLSQDKPLSDALIFNALKMSFVDLNRSFRGSDGCTATVAIVINKELWVANTGDSRIVLDNNGKTIQLTDDAKPSSRRFKNSIHKRGGIVISSDTPRVNGQLAVARAIGDHAVIGQNGLECITPRPKIVKKSLSELNPQSRLIIACDGLWDVCTSNQAVRLTKNDPTAAEKLVRAAYVAKSGDNISVMTVDIPGTAIQKNFFLRLFGY